MIRILLLSLSVLLAINLSAQNTTTVSGIAPDRDNVIFSESNNSNGAGVHLVTGRTNGGNLRRALFHFDVAAAIPSGVTITEVSLNFRVNRANNSTMRSTGLHALTQDFGEGTSSTTGSHGQGAPSTEGDATWNDAISGTNSVAWNTAGGDYNSTASASTMVGGVASYSISDTLGSQLVSDVQGWLDDPSTNFGWIMIGAEGTNATAKRISSRENSSNPVSLTITYENPSTSLSNSVSSDFSIYPNPANDFITINGLNKIENVQIIDLNGQIRNSIDNPSSEISISDLDKGIYLLRVTTGDQMITKKLIKK